jgi:hypothetical protein
VNRRFNPTKNIVYSSLRNYRRKATGYKVHLKEQTKDEKSFLVFRGFFVLRNFQWGYCLLRRDTIFRLDRILAASANKPNDSSEIGSFHDVVSDVGGDRKLDSHLEKLFGGFFETQQLEAQSGRSSGVNVLVAFFTHGKSSGGEVNDVGMGCNVRRFELDGPSGIQANAVAFASSVVQGESNFVQHAISRFDDSRPVARMNLKGL